MCGSTSVACCPGPVVYGSELISIKFAPTGLPGCVWVGEEEELEHPANASVRRTVENAVADLSRRTQLVRIARKGISSQRLIIFGRASNVNRNSPVTLH